MILGDHPHPTLDASFSLQKEGRRVLATKQAKIQDSFEDRDGPKGTMMRQIYSTPCI